jgi:hypothetical protein
MRQTLAKPKTAQAVGMARRTIFVRQCAYCGSLSLISAMVVGTILTVF